MMKRLLQTTLIALFVALAQRASYAQNTWYVDDDCAPPGVGTEVDPFCTIQDGVNASSDGDTVWVAPGTYTGDGNRDISLFGKQLMLRSTGGADMTFVDSQGAPSAAHRGFFLDHGETREATIEGFTITGGYLIGDTGGSGPAGGGGGAGIYLGASNPTIRDCVIVGNVSRTVWNPFLHDGRGGGLYLDRQSSAVIENCVIWRNEADRQGGGMLHVGGEDTATVIRNCLFAFNCAEQGGGIHSAGGQAIFTNNTIFNNTASISGGGFKNEQSQGLITNSVLWENVSDHGAQIYVQGPLLRVEYSVIEGGGSDIAGPGAFEWGPGNLDADPLFFDPHNGDFHLLHGSPVIDAGNNLAVPEEVTTDLDGGPRFLDDPNIPDTGNPDPDAPKLPIVDMGPYEFDHLDCNNNDVPDEQDIANGTSLDCNTNTIPDDCESDCNENNQADSCDIAEGISDDCNDNGMPDECEVDCNDNGRPDSCDIADGVSEDCNANAVPDECEPDEDCNTNGVQDICDIADRTSEDCNANGTPDECETEPDCNDNGQFDSCDIAEGISVDCFGENGQPDGVPDECCPGDVGLDKDNVGRFDVAGLLATWGPCPDSCIEGVPACQCPADFDRNCIVNAFDLAFLLGHWGPCPPP